MKHLVILLIGWLSVIDCNGQDSVKKNSLSLNFGPGYLIQQDVIFSQFIHSDLTFMNVGLDFTHQEKQFQNVRLRYGNFNPMTSKIYDFKVHGESETAYPHSFNLIDMEYLLGKSIMTTENRMLTIGGMLSSDIQAMNYVYGRISSFGYYTAFGLGIFGRYGLVLNDKNRITTSLQFPFLSWLSRPPYMGIDDEFIENISSHSGVKTFMAFVGDGELVSWNRFQTFDFGMIYTYSLNGKFDFGTGYLLEFIHAIQPQNLLSFRNTINISVAFKF